ALGGLGYRHGRRRRACRFGPLPPGGQPHQPTQEQRPPGNRYRTQFKQRGHGIATHRVMASFRKAKSPPPRSRVRGLIEPCPPQPCPLAPALFPASAPPHICSHVSSPQARDHAHGGHARRNRQLHPVLPPCSTTAITNPKRHPTCLRSRPTTRLCLTP